MSAARAKAIDLAQHALVHVNPRNGISNTGDAHAEVEVLIDSIIYAAVEASVEQSLKRLKRHAGLYAGQPRIGDPAGCCPGNRGSLSGG